MTSENTVGTNPAITAYNKSEVFRRENKYEGKTVTVPADTDYSIGTVLAALEATGKLVAFDASKTDGSENSAFILAQAIVNNAGSSATAGFFLSPDISANLAGILALTDAEFRITVDGGTPEDVDSIDFSTSGATTMADVADILQVAIQEDVTVEAISDTIKVTSNSTGASSSILFATHGTPTGTDLTGASYLNVAGGAYTAGADSVAVDFDNTQICKAGIVDGSLLVFPNSETIDTIVSGKGKVIDLLKNNRIDVITGNENTALDNGAVAG